MKLQPTTEHPHGTERKEFDFLFTKRQARDLRLPRLPLVIHRLTYRAEPPQLPRRGYKEEGTITTPFDMTVLNELDRFHLVGDVIERVPQVGSPASSNTARPRSLVEHKRYIRKNGHDMPEIRDWKWARTRGTGAPWPVPRETGDNA